VSRRSEITVDLGALRRNVLRMREAAAPAELWAVVKGDAYGHGMIDVARASLEAGAAGLCVATAHEGEALRRSFPDARILAMAPVTSGEAEVARASRLELAISSAAAPDGIDLHLKVDTGMGRWGMSVEEARSVPRGRVVGLMSHLATADEPDPVHAREQIARFAAAAEEFEGVPAHIANSAATLVYSEARFDFVRCGIAIYGLSPFGDDPAAHGLEPVLSWRSYVALAKTVPAGGSVGYGRRFVAERPTRIGIVPVGYADGFRRGLTGTDVLVGDERRAVVGVVSMDALAVVLADEDEGAPVTLLGDGVLAEEHARRLGTINYEITTGIRSDPLRAERRVVDG
jgi:alanine racemase